MKRMFLYLLSFTVLANLSASAQADLLWRFKSDFVGTVIDTTTRQPLEGVYVLAEYLEGGGNWFGHGGSWCVRTAGVHTDKSGRFTFPHGPAGVPVFRYIKEGYQYDSDTTILEQRRRGESGTPKINYMVSRNLTTFRSTQYFKCERPRSAADVAANIVYLEYLAEEDRRYNAAPTSQEVVKRAIDALKKFPHNTTDGAVTR